MKDLPPPHDPIEAMGEAYELLLEKSMKEAQKAKEKTGPALHGFIDEMKEKSQEMKELASEERDRIAGYLKRDLVDAAEFMNTTGKNVKEWLGLEDEEVEDKLLDLVSKAADQTTVELQNLKAEVQDLDYYAGELTLPGTLVCVQCGHKMRYHKPGKIARCEECQSKHFKRDWR
jgi:hypothetical protein